MTKKKASVQAMDVDERIDAYEQEEKEIAEAMDGEDEDDATEEASDDAAEETEQPEAEADAAADPDRHHEERITEASQAVADAAVQLSRAQAAAKVAKKHFEVAVEELEGIIDRGPERLPLFDSANGQPVTSVGKTPTYEPPLEEGQCRVRIITMSDSAYDADGYDEKYCPDAVVIMEATREQELLSPQDTEAEFYLLESQDDYEILEYWPEGAEEPTVFDPPLRFGPNKPEPVEDADPDAWRQESVGTLNIPNGTINKLRDAGLVTVGQLSDRMVGVQWYRGIPGIGEQAAEKIADAFEAFWQQHPEAVD